MVTFRARKSHFKKKIEMKLMHCHAHILSTAMLPSVKTTRALGVEIAGVPDGYTVLPSKPV